jgi:cytochrome c556
MTADEVDERIGSVVDTARKVWFASTAVGTVWVLFNLPWWAVTLWAGISVATYYLSMWISAMVAIAMLAPEAVSEANRHSAMVKLGQKLNDESATEEEIQQLYVEAGVERTQVVEHSEVIGMWKGEEIYDWVKVKQGETVGHLNFERYADFDSKGNAILPTEANYALWKGVIYKLQPEEAEKPAESAI